MNGAPGLSFDKQVWVLSVMDKMVDLLALLSTMGGKESGRGIGAVVKLVKAVFAEASSMDSVQGGNSMVYNYCPCKSTIRLTFNQIVGYAVK